MSFAFPRTIFLGKKSITGTWIPTSLVWHINMERLLCWVPFRVVSMLLEKPMIMPPSRVSDVFSMLPSKHSTARVIVSGHFYALSRKIVERFFSPPLSPPCDFLGFVPAGSVSSSPTLQISSRLWWFLWPLVHLLYFVLSVYTLIGSVIRTKAPLNQRPL